ncbi:ribonuclease Z [Paenibacillus radicis (ex Xue et al. 2023)]|uniref:Ribonuclease Z n=1 Tax=Paenibacillus radicis (ex Xue et al. 2023) TaxID=2972489 RepID=A0ABT1YFE1_9BACL|nr:ribonuclease Z [Paenibacillus radicis (ex Xue et al. 2023)]MCR8631896.1 ribonuclease Z [Paenibacillus radicis (ex Xue et al. 2023)]
MEIYFLGTGAGMPSKDRNVTSIILNLLAERNTYWMFDCGEGTQHQALRSPIRIGKLEKLFITHLHGDHIYGIPGLLTSRSYQGGDTPFTVYGPRGTEQFILTALSLSQAHLSYELIIQEFDVTEETILFEDEQFVVSIAPLIHRVDSHGYRIVEKPQKGRLLVEKLKELGITSGPVFGKLKQGFDVTLEDGTFLIANEYIGPSYPGRIVTILGDTQPCENTSKLAKGANVLVHEATFAEQKKHLAVEYDHSTAMDAARAAREAGVETLILTHISSRYQRDEAELLVQEAKQIHDCTYLARDHWSYEVPRSKR